MFSLPLSISALAVLLTFFAAAYQDGKTRTVFRATWYPAVPVCTICGIFFWPEILKTPAGVPALLFSLFLAVLFIVFAKLGMFGKADAKALVLLSLAVPVTPFAAWTFPSLTVSVILNAGILSLAVPLFCLGYNIIQKNNAPFWLMCSGRPVAGSTVKDRFGFVAETVCATENGIEKQFVTLKDSLFSLKGSPERQTRNLREHREVYAETLQLLEKCETVWVTVGIPLLIPLTAGLVLALFGVSVPDFLFAVL